MTSSGRPPTILARLSRAPAMSSLAFLPAGPGPAAPSLLPLPPHPAPAPGLTCRVGAAGVPPGLAGRLPQRLGHLGGQRGGGVVVQVHAAGRGARRLRPGTHCSRCCGDEGAAVGAPRWVRPLRARLRVPLSASPAVMAPAPATPPAPIGRPQPPPARRPISSRPPSRPAPPPPHWPPAGGPRLAANRLRTPPPSPPLPIPLSPLPRGAARRALTVTRRSLPASPRRPIPSRAEQAGAAHFRRVPAGAGRGGEGRERPRRCPSPRWRRRPRLVPPAPSCASSAEPPPRWR